MTSAISPITRQATRPYLSLAEFKSAPTALDYSNLVVGGTQAQQDAELTNAIYRASSWIDQYCNQIIGATADVEQQRVRIRPDGTIRFHPKYFPLVALNSLSIGYQPNSLTAIADVSSAWLEEQQVIFPYSQIASSMSSQGPLGFGFPSSSRAEAFINYSYINGYANSAIASSASAGQTSITLASGLGIIAGEMLTIFDGASTERVIVASNYSFGSATVPLTAPLAYSHAVDVTVSNLPAAVKEACILMTSAYLKIRGDASMTMAVTSAVTKQSSSDRVASDVAHASELLKPFRRIR